MLTELPAHKERSTAKPDDLTERSNIIICITKTQHSLCRIRGNLYTHRKLEKRIQCYAHFVEHRIRYLGADNRQRLPQCCCSKPLPLPGRADILEKGLPPLASVYGCHRSCAHCVCNVQKRQHSCQAASVESQPGGWFNYFVIKYTCNCTYMVWTRSTFDECMLRRIRVVNFPSLWRGSI